MQSNKNKLDNESFFMLKFNESIDNVILFAFKGAYMVFFAFNLTSFFFLTTYQHGFLVPYCMKNE